MKPCTPAPPLSSELLKQLQNGPVEAGQSSPQSPVVKPLPSPTFDNLGQIAKIITEARGFAPQLETVVHQCLRKDVRP